MTHLTGPSGSLAGEVYRIPFDDAAKPLPTEETVGSKAHNLMRLARRGLPVPPAFVLSTGVCRDYLRRGAAALEGLGEIFDRELQQLGVRTGRHLGDAKRPLLLSVRSGAAVSMPGMMETVLNVGLTDVTLRALIRMTGNPRLAHDCQRRLVQQYGEVVHAIPPARFERRLKALFADLGASDGDELDTGGLERIAHALQDDFESATGRRLPSDPLAQLKAAVEAVFRSWESARARSYRTLNGIPDDLGTAAIVQAMVFGNLGPSSGSGVGFTRNPADGSNELYVDYLPNAQGEDVVAGRRRAMGPEELERRAPEAYRSLIEARPLLEQEFRDMQDFEFTVEEGRLFLLQSRAGKRTPLAALRIAHDLAEEGLISASEALARIDAVELGAIENVGLKPTADQVALARGTSASAGVAIGAVAFDPERVSALKQRGKPVILVRETAETSDIGALSEAAALITAEGARTSHAAVVARQLGRVCIVGCEGLSIDPSGRKGVFGAETIKEGEIVSVDGVKGEIYRGAIEVRRERPTELLSKIERWRGREESGIKRVPA
ncbi:MAG: pyruvate, phosphate dikinase [Alphaproteobacteria bacterium]